MPRIRHTAVAAALVLPLAGTGTALAAPQHGAPAPAPACPGGSSDPTWDRAWRRLDGWKRWVTVAGSGRFALTDLPVLGAQLGMSDPAEPLPGQRAGEITLAASRAGRPSPPWSSRS